MNKKKLAIILALFISAAVFAGLFFIKLTSNNSGDNNLAVNNFQKQEINQKRENSSGDSVVINEKEVKNFENNKEAAQEKENDLRYKNENIGISMVFPDYYEIFQDNNEKFQLVRYGNDQKIEFGKGNHGEFYDGVVLTVYKDNKLKTIDDVEIGVKKEITNLIEGESYVSGKPFPSNYRRSDFSEKNKFKSIISYSFDDRSIKNIYVYLNDEEEVIVLVSWIVSYSSNNYLEEYKKEAETIIYSLIVE